MSRSGYLKRRLSESSEITLSPPLTITAETFSTIVDFCYGHHIVITPFNVVALRIATELLEMTESNGNTDGNLRWKTETYFCQALSVNREYAGIILRSCLALLPEAEQTALMTTRCIEALCFMDDMKNWIGDVKLLTPDEFQTIANSMHGRFTFNHDLLYRIIDFYLKENIGKITEEQIIRLCSSVDCNKLSPKLLIHAVQNPRMPIKFIVRATLVEQFNTRRSIFSRDTRDLQYHNNGGSQNNEAVSLGTILKRDAALRQVSLLKASMEAVSVRIQSLERELKSTKKLLSDSEKKRYRSELGRSASFRFDTENKIHKEEKGLTRSSSFRFGDRGERVGRGPSDEMNSKIVKSSGWRFLKGLKSVFRTSSSSIMKMRTENQVSGGRVDENDGNIAVMKEDI